MLLHIRAVLATVKRSLAFVVPRVHQANRLQCLLCEECVVLAMYKRLTVLCRSMLLVCWCGELLCDHMHHASLAVVMRADEPAVVLCRTLYRSTLPK